MFTNVLLSVVPAIVGVEKPSFVFTTKVNESVLVASKLETAVVAPPEVSEVVVGVAGDVDVVNAVEVGQVLDATIFVGNSKPVSVLSCARNDVVVDRVKLSQTGFEVKVDQCEVKAVK